MKIVILAAGKGERLLPLTRNTPKCLLEIGEGHTLLEAQLMAIDAAGGADEVIIVTGYRSAQIEAKVSSFENRTPVRILYNPFFAVSNNIASLWLALQAVEDDIVVVNGDDLFHPSVLSGLLEKAARHEIIMTIDRKDEYDDDDMKIIDDGTLLSRVGKDVPIAKATGESIGMISFRGDGRARIRDAVESIVRKEEGLGQFWLKAVQALVDDGRHVHLHEVSADSWREMDFHPDREEIQRHLSVVHGLESWWWGV